MQIETLAILLALLIGCFATVVSGQSFDNPLPLDPGRAAFGDIATIDQCDVYQLTVLSPTWIDIVLAPNRMALDPMPQGLLTFVDGVPNPDGSELGTPGWGGAFTAGPGVPQTIALEVPPGRYWLAVNSSGNAGDLGAYSIDATVTTIDVPEPPALLILIVGLLPFIRRRRPSCLRA